MPTYARENARIHTRIYIYIEISVSLLCGNTNTKNDPSDTEHNQPRRGIGKGNRGVPGKTGQRARHCLPEILQRDGDGIPRQADMP